MCLDKYPLVSNFAYLGASIYLIIKKKYIFAFFAAIIWFISHGYHQDTTNKSWMYADYIVVFIGFMYVMITCKDILFCLKNIILLIILLIIFIYAFYNYYHNMSIYYIYHSIWHIMSALFILMLIDRYNS
jgi:hypothetical protein